MTLAKKIPSLTPLPIEDDERHSGEVDDFIGRNREALNDSLRLSREQGVSEASVADVIAAGRRRRERLTGWNGRARLRSSAYAHRPATAMVGSPAAAAHPKPVWRLANAPGRPLAYLTLAGNTRVAYTQ